MYYKKISYIHILKLQECKNIFFVFLRTVLNSILKDKEYHLEIDYGPTEISLYFNMISVWFFPPLLFYKLKDKKKKYEPPVPTRVGKKKKKTKGPDAASKLPLGNECHGSNS